MESCILHSAERSAEGFFFPIPSPLSLSWEDQWTKGGCRTWRPHHQGTVASSMVNNSGCQPDTIKIQAREISVTSRGFPVDWANYRTSQQKPERTQRIKEPVAPLHTDNTVWGRRKRKKNDFLLIVKLENFCFAISKNEAYKENIIRDRK